MSVAHREADDLAVGPCPDMLICCVSFDLLRFVPVMKKDGKYVLLKEEEYNRLKDEGQIVNRYFVVDYDDGSNTEAPPMATSDKKEKVMASWGGGSGETGCRMR